MYPKIEDWNEGMIHGVELGAMVTEAYTGQTLVFSSLGLTS